MITLPSIVVACDRCTRSITQSGWANQTDLVHALRSDGWKVGAPNIAEGTLPCLCPACAQDPKKGQ